MLFLNRTKPDIYDINCMLEILGGDREKTTSDVLPLTYISQVDPQPWYDQNAFYESLKTLVVYISSRKIRVLRFSCTKNMTVLSKGLES